MFSRVFKFLNCLLHNLINKTFTHIHNFLYTFYLFKLNTGCIKVKVTFFLEECQECTL